MSQLKHRLALVMTASALGFALTPVQAADFSWTGLGGNDKWSTAANWSPSGPPGPANPGVNGVIFSDATFPTSTNDLTFGYYTNITFQNGDFTIIGQNLGLNAGSLTSVSGNNTIPGLVRGGAPGNRAIDTQAGQLTMGPLNMQGQAVQINGGGTTVINGPLGGGSTSLLRIFSFGSGETVLGGDNNAWGGKINIFRFAKLTHPGGLGGSNTTVNLDRSYDNAWIDLNGLAVSNVNVSMTALEVPSSTKTAMFRNTSTTAAIFAGNITNNIAPFCFREGNMTFSGTITGTNNILKTTVSSGLVYLTGTNLCTGSILSSNGTLICAYSFPQTLSNSIVVGSPGQFQENSSSTTTYNGPISGNGKFRIFSLGLAVLGADNSAFAGKMNIFRSAKLTHAQGLGGASTTLTLDRSYANAYVDLNGLSVSNVNVTFDTAENGGDGGTRLARLRNSSGTAAVFAGDLSMVSSNSVGVDGSGDLTLGGVISGASTDNGLTKLDAGTLTLTGLNTYLGVTTVSGGTLLVNGDNSAATGDVLVSTNATLGGIGTIGGNVTFDTGAMAIFTNGSTLTISGTLTANDNVVKLNLPANVGPGTNLLATYSGGSGSFASAPVIANGGSFAANTTNYITTGGGQVNLVVQNVAPSTPPATNITYTVSSGQLVLEWPNGLGWKLQAQTNNLNAGITTNWSTITGAASPFTNAINPGNPTVFYRLTYP